MMLVERAFRDLFPEKEFLFTGVVRYSGRFRSFNANVHLNRFTRTITFNLSRKWRGVSEDIIIGLLQSLMLRLFRKKGSSLNIDLYHNFIRNVHIAVPKNRFHPVLEESFNRVNRLFFDGFVDKPNLVVGRGSLRTVGRYDYGSDSITISPVVLDYVDLLDYVMYHELLHKKHKFRSGSNRTFHHTNAFRRREKAYPNAKELEEKLSRVLKRKRGLFSWF